MFTSGSASRSGAELVTALRARLPTAPLTRFAPAPTGPLHLGHVVNALYVWGLAGALGGRVLLRIEDHDRQRARAENERMILDDLDWLGFSADLYPSSAYRNGPCDGRQSERNQVYLGALAPLIAAGLVYGCQCSRASQAAADPLFQPPSTNPAERRYAGTCRDRGIVPGDGVGWRLRLNPGSEVFDDALLGRQEQDPSLQCGDLLLRDRLGNWTYQCVAAIDDAVQGVTLVVRGHDLLSSTGRQLRLARIAGRATAPEFVHHPLVMKSATQKLSKSDGDSGIRDLRSAGWSAGRVIGCAAALAGLTQASDPLTVQELPKLFGQQAGLE